MKFLFHTFIVFDFPIFFITKSNNILSFFWQHQEIIIIEQKTFDWWFPKLIAFIPILNKMFFWLNINNKNVISIDTNHLVRANNITHSWDCLSSNFVLFIHQGNINICNIQFVVPSNQIIWFFSLFSWKRFVKVKLIEIKP